MKIVCIGRNYSAHARELGNPLPTEPLFFLKPSTAVLGKGLAFRIPAWTTDVHHEAELVFRIAKRCTNVAENDALSHIDGVTIGLDLTARDIQEQLKQQGAPWEKAKAFDGSAVIGDRFIELPKNRSDLSFELQRNGTVVQRGAASDMIFSLPVLLAHVSRFITLEPGDVLFSGTPEGVGKLEPGDRIMGLLQGEPMLKLRVEG